MIDYNKLCKKMYLRKMAETQNHQLEVKTFVVGEMKMGNIAPRAGNEPISLVFQASMLTITPPSLSAVTKPPTHTCI